VTTNCTAIGVGLCPGGKIGRLVNALRGFVNIGFHVAEGGSGEAFRYAFAQRVLARDDLSPTEKREQAVLVLDEYGIAGKIREDWLSSLSDV
jgi:hypothetical protein